MRILFAIAHYYFYDPNSPYSSLAAKPEMRAAGLVNTLCSLHQLFGQGHYIFDHSRRGAVPVNQAEQNEFTAVVCTTRGRHLLDRLRLPAGAYLHHPTDVEPMLLEFECQAVLRDGLGRYDYFCFLEDDLLIHDPWFFRKLAWFTRAAGNECLLQPRRYEVDGIRWPVRRFYLDGDMVASASAPFAAPGGEPELVLNYLDRWLRFVRPLNPHAASFFLNAEQMAHWAGKPYFLDRDVSFIGPLESAASLGIMRTFRIYKAAYESPGFLEIQHFDNKHIAAVPSRLPFIS